MREIDMPIEATCSECSRHYTLKEELAGKKIRCKSCSAVIAIPAAKKSVKKSNDDEFRLDDEVLLEIDDEFDDSEEQEFPRKRAKKPIADKNARGKKRKKKSGSSSSLLGSIVKIGGGVVGFIVAFVLVGNIVRIALSSSNWKPYEVPGAPGCKIDFPKAPRSKTDFVGTPALFSEGANYSCAAMSEPIDPQIQHIFADLVNNRNIIEIGLATTMPQARIQSSRAVNEKGVSAAEFTLVTGDTYNVKRTFIAHGRIITLDFLFRTPHPTEMERFFRSFKAPGFTNPTFDLPNNAPTMTVPGIQTNTIPGNAVPGSTPADNPIPQNSNPNNVSVSRAPSASPKPIAPIVNVETPASMLVPDTPVDPNAPPTVRRSAWRYGDAPTIFEGQTSNAGVFLKKLGDNWVEQRKRAATTYWNETARTAEYIEIMRTDRSVFVRLYADRSEYRFGAEPEFKSMYPGIWE